MLSLNFVSIFPELIIQGLSYGITQRAIDKGLIKLNTANPRDYGLGRYRRVDDAPYGGGPGMVLMLGPLQKAIDKIKQKNSVFILPSPRGLPFSAAAAVELAKKKHLVFICGRYEGIDERMMQLYTVREYSVGDFVVSGGELPALLLADAIIRRVPGALGNKTSAEQDSFETGSLDYPHYTRPEEFATISVPAVLRSGDHPQVAAWRMQQALRRTWQTRPELLARLVLNDAQRRLMAQALLEPKEQQDVNDDAGNQSKSTKKRSAVHTNRRPSTRKP